MSSEYDAVQTDEVDANPSKITSCVNSCVACPGKFAHFLYHTTDEGVNLCCLLTFLNWGQLCTFLISLYIVAGGFWALMFYFVTAWPMKALYAFLISAALFCGLFGVLMALEANNDEGSKTMGCSEEALREHISGQFQKGMTWENFGYKWHIVHKMQLHEDNPSAEVSDRITQVCERLHYLNTMPVFTEDLRRGSYSAQKETVKPEQKEEKVVVVMHQ
jgi:hypothetical protein